MPASTPSGEPVPKARNMYPNWLTVEYASTRFRSVWVKAINPASSAVKPPMTATVICAVSLTANSGVQRVTM